MVLVLAVAGVVVGCAPEGEETGSSEADLTFAPTVKGNVGGRIRDLTPQEALDLRIVSHDKILMWEGIVEHVGKPNAEVHLIDTKRFEGHLGYTQHGLGRGAQYTEGNFFTEIQYPGPQRRYMPFFLFDFRSAPITIDGKSFKWVMNIRRYNYRDNEKQLADLLVTMKNLLGEHVMKGYGDPALFVYDSPPAAFLRRPHVTQLGELTRRGFTPITEPDMIRLAGGKLVAVLNPGTAYGYLKLVKAGEAAATEERLTPRHIAVFQDTPDRVPPVSGIVTLEPQTPLSHVNLLAKNRGTPNASTAQISLIPSMEPLFDKLVRMDAKEDGTVAFREASLDEATKFWNERQRNALEVPRIAPISLDPVEFATAEGAVAELPNIGSKAANYAVIQKLLGPSLVKPGFALGFAHYRALIAGAPAERLIADLVAKKDTLAPEDIDARLAQIREAIKTQTPEAALAAPTAAVRAIAAKLPGVARIRFRSSTNSEDLPVFNGAGLYESDGFDVADSDKKLQKKLLGVMSSLWLERAFWERELFGIKHADVAMAILVNPAFSDETANGVVVGGPNAAGTFASWVNAQKGEASVTNPLEGEVPESFTVTGRGNLTITKLDSRSNIGDVFLEGSADRIAPALASQLAELHAATEKLYAHFVGERVAEGDTQPYAIDLEYKLMTENGAAKLYIKQTRLLALR
ncbi:MAG: hypothetical protein KF837_12635 [Labilithrix sp.]|nr:hypothetical protein [Labilithrix sp.]